MNLRSSLCPLSNSAASVKPVSFSTNECKSFNKSLPAGRSIPSHEWQPTYAEEWQIPPPAYDLYTNVPYTGAEADTFEAPMRPQSYPYGQYLTNTNLMPGDEYYTRMGCGGARTAREYVNSTFLRHDLARRENMTRLYKKQLSRRFRNNTNDTFSPFVSY